MKILFLFHFKLIKLSGFLYQRIIYSVYNEYRDRNFSFKTRRQLLKTCFLVHLSSYRIFVLFYIKLFYVLNKTFTMGFWLKIIKTTKTIKIKYKPKLYCIGTSCGINVEFVSESFDIILRNIQPTISFKLFLKHSVSFSIPFIHRGIITVLNRCSFGRHRTAKLLEAIREIMKATNLTQTRCNL